MAGSAGAVGREDAAVAGQHRWVQVLVDMGFPPDRARQALAAHRSVEEAVEALTPPQWQTLPASADGGWQERSSMPLLRTELRRGGRCLEQLLITGLR